MLLVFHPCAFTPVCAEEALDLQANLESFRNAETEVVFVSCDSSATRQAWKKELGATYTFASDFWQHGAAARAYGVFDEETGAPVRGTFLIDKDGVVIWSLVKEGTAHGDGSATPSERSTSRLEPPAARRAWGDPSAPRAVCLHGVTGHGGGWRRLAEPRLQASTCSRPT